MATSAQNGVIHFRASLSDEISILQRLPRYNEMRSEFQDHEVLYSGEGVRKKQS